MGTDDEPTEEPQAFRRTSRLGSMRKFVNSSIRRTRKILGIEGPNDERDTPPPTVRSFRDMQIQEFNRNDSFRMSRISTKNYQVNRVTLEDRIFCKIRPLIPPVTCPLIKFFPKEGKSHDHKSMLNSFERKRRSHQVFGVDHHAKEQLFCPLQASQIEFAFRTQIKTDILIKVQAPNGEVSTYINPDTVDFKSYSPSNIGCGHGTWLVHVARRRGCKFHHCYTKTLNLVGQGILYFEVEHNGVLREVERLWLDCLN